MTVKASNRRYILEDKLGEGGMGAVYRAKDRLNGELVAYKKLLNTQNMTALDTVIGSQSASMTLAREFEVVATLKHPYIINVLDYGFDQDFDPYFTMDILAEPKTIVDASAKQPLRERVRILYQFLQALSYLHRRKVIHCDLKPDNVLVNADGSVKVVDFGLATLQNQKNTDDDLDTVAGTLAYIAPEVLHGATVSFTADMYAVGLMAVEILTGKHPYGEYYTSSLMSKILVEDPELDHIHDLDWQEELTEGLSDDDEIPIIDNYSINSSLVYLFEDLLRKDPRDRIDNPDTVIERLAQATQVDPPAETIEIRESFLQAANFIGRKEELTLLSDALIETVNGKGSRWLIAGETGVGKSRLLNELRTIASIRQLLVFRGQEASRGSGYALWKNVLRHLIVNVNINDIEASILKPVVNDISSILDREIPDPASLEPQQVKERFNGTVASLFRRLTQPVLLLLEDLQWTNESLDLLNRLISLTDEMSLMIIGTVRSDERPSYEEDFSTLKPIKLERLSREQVEQLAVSMIGDSGRNSALLDLLQEQTEGNTFFLVEVMRSLADAAGQLSKVGTMELPSIVFSGGIETIIQNRLSHVPDAMTQLLQIAVLMGRTLDLTVLQHLATVQKMIVNIDSLLTTCINIAVLDKDENDWRFVHDLFRSELVKGISEADVISQHKSIAEAIETVHDATAKADELAYHWAGANNDSKEKYYSILAGEKALAISSFDRAQTYLTRAIELETDDVALASLYYKLGETERALSHFDTAITHYEKSRSLHETGLPLLGLGRTYLDKGEPDVAVPYLNEALEAVRASEDKTSESFVLYGLSRAELYSGKVEESNKLAEQAKDAAEEAKEKRGKSLALFALGMGNLRLGNLESGREYLTEAEEIDRSIGNRRGEAFSRMYIGISHLLQHQFTQGLNSVEEARQIALDIGDRRLESVSLNNLGNANLVLGNYDQVVTIGERSIHIAEEIGDQRTGAEAMVNVSESLIMTGDLTRAKSLALDGIEQGEKIKLHYTIGQALGNLGLAHLIEGNDKSALDFLRRGVELGNEYDIADTLRRVYGYLADYYMKQGEFEKALEKAENGLQHENDDDPWFAPLMKVCALIALERKEDAQTYLHELKTQVEKEIEETPDKEYLQYIKGYILSALMIVDGVQNMMEHYVAARDAYDQGIRERLYYGLVVNHIRQLGYLQPYDQNQLIDVVIAELDDAKDMII